MQGFIRLIRRWPLWVKLLATLMAIAVVCVSTFSIITSRSDKSITSMVNLAETEQVTISQTKVPALPNTTVTVVKKTATAPPKDHLPMGTCRGAWHPKEGVEILPCGRATINKDETHVYPLCQRERSVRRRLGSACRRTGPDQDHKGQKSRHLQHPR